jgi:hypothetical protein
VVGKHEERKKVAMTVHELARELLKMPDIEVRVYAEAVDRWDTEMGADILEADKFRDLNHKLIDHEFVGIW